VRKRRSAPAQQADAVLQQFREHAAGAHHQHLSELGIDDHAGKDLGDAVDDHLLHEKAVREGP
jgi:hypothetical protein